MKYCAVCKAKYDAAVSFCPVDGEVLETDPSSIVNTVLDGQYQVEALLGRGGMGAVYSARHIMLGNAVAGGAPIIKLLDLGIAKLREVADSGAKATTLTMAGQMLGTPYYMSPEQWGELPRDGSSEIDGRADIYSLALVLYEMIAGRRPYSALTLLELRKEHVSVTPRRLDEVMADVPPAFSKVVARAMAKDRGDRPATAGEFLKELKKALASGDEQIGAYH